MLSVMMFSAVCLPAITYRYGTRYSRPQKRRSAYLETTTANLSRLYGGLPERAGLSRRPALRGAFINLRFIRSYHYYVMLTIRLAENITGRKRHADVLSIITTGGGGKAFVKREHPGVPPLCLPESVPKTATAWSSAASTRWHPATAINQR